jgi:hypothetical protein
MKPVSPDKIISKTPHDLSDHVDTDSILDFYHPMHNRINLKLLPNDSA